MKKLLAAGALVALIASPAFAKEADHMSDYSWTVPHVFQPAPGYGADIEYGPRGEVIWNGHDVVGIDPDPFWSVEIPIYSFDR